MMFKLNIYYIFIIIANVKNTKSYITNLKIMSLAKTYCKEIIRELDKIPVFLPGTPVSVGDIITFGKGFVKPRPIGSFDPISKLSSLGVSYQEEDDENPDTYLYASKGSVGVSFIADANAATVGNGRLEISFNKEASTYFAALDCTVKSIVDAGNLEPQLDIHKKKIDWKNCYIVTSVTIAKKALIMQSNSQNSSLVIEGDVKGLQAGANMSVDANISVKINTYKDSSFIKDWSDNVTVFFTLARFRKKFLGDWGLATKKAMYINQDSDIYELTPVYPDDLLLEEDE